MSDASQFEARRYSAVLIAADDTLTSRATLVALGCPARQIKKVDVASSDWAFVAGRVEADTNYSRAIRSAVGSEGTYSHRVYAAEGQIGGNPYLLVASPYVRLLGDCITRIDRSRNQAVVYLKPSMDRLFGFFESMRPSELSATRITVLMEGDVGLELVSLSGRNPLRSDLRHALLEVASPYSIRVKGTYIDRRGMNLHADRHGNFWFHLGSEAALVNVAAFLSAGSQHGDLRATTNSPLKRVADEE